MRRIAFSALALSLLAGSALAADLPVRGPAPAPVLYAAPVFTWTGFYVGLQAGYAWQKSDFNNSLAGVYDPTYSARVKPDGFVGGAHAGYNWQMGAVVLGLEGDIEGAGVRGSTAFVSGGGESLIARSRIGWMGSLRGRLGFAAGNALIYATGGAAFADIRNSIIDVTNAEAFSKSSTRAGWTLGAGIEYAINPAWSVRAEYRYTDFGKTRIDTLAATAVGDTYHVKSDMHAVRLGLTYRFGMPAGAVVAKY